MHKNGVSVKNQYKHLELIQICEIKSGRSIRGAITEVEDTGIRIVQMKDLSVDGISWDSCISTELTGKSAPDWLVKGDILVLARGNQNYAVLVDDFINDINAKVIAAPYFFVLQAKTEKVHSTYLTWWLNQKPVQNYFKTKSRGTGSLSLPRSALEETEIVLPTVKEQQIIASLYSNLAQQKAVQQELISNSEQLLAGIAQRINKNKEGSR